MVLNQVESGRLCQSMEQLAREDVLASMVYAWLWLRCAEAGTPGVFVGPVDAISAAFGWGRCFMNDALSRLVQKNKLLRTAGPLVLPEYVRLPADPEEARLWAHHVWELQASGQGELAAYLDDKILQHCQGARSLRRTYEMARNR